MAAAAAARSRRSPAAFSVPPAARADWEMFDPTILMGEVLHPAAVCAASNGGQVRVSLRLAEPPASSYVEMYIDAELHGHATVLAADGDPLLIHTVLAIRDPPPRTYQDNYFVYRAYQETPSLLLLPQFDDWDAHPLHTGISCRGGEFVVAAFYGEGSSSGGKVGVLSRFSSSTGQWEIKELLIPFDSDKGLYPFVWDTDNVFSFRGLMCWVDYHRGILYSDVFSDHPGLQFVQLPGIEIWDYSHDYCNTSGVNH